MSDFDNLKQTSAFDDTDITKTQDSAITSGTKQKDVHIRVQQRNGRKCITTLQGLNPKLDFDRMAKEFKKRWGCNGIVVEDKEAGSVIQLQGDQREHLKEFLLGEKLAKMDTIRVHGL
jgi:translation initiation factor 1